LTYMGDVTMPMVWLRAHFFRASRVALTAGERGRVLAKAVGLGNPGDGFVAMARAGKGEVIALGQSLWCFWITPKQDPSGGNARLLRWLLDSGHQRRQRIATLARPLSPAEVERYWVALAGADSEAAADAVGVGARRLPMKRPCPSFDNTCRRLVRPT
jgi:hypothetical protein